MGSKVSIEFEFPSHAQAFEFWDETSAYAQNFDAGELAAKRKGCTIVEVTCTEDLVQYAEPNAAEFGGVRL